MDETSPSRRSPKAREFAEGRFRGLLEAAPDAIIEVDRQGHIVLLNAVTEKLFGYSREELLGKSVDALIPDAARDRHAAHRAGYWANPQTRSMGQGLLLFRRAVKTGSEFPIEISLSPVKSGKSFRVTAIIRDVTMQRIAEEKSVAPTCSWNNAIAKWSGANRLKSELLCQHEP